MEFWRNKKVCVTGAAGFVGTELCIQLREAGAQVTEMDIVSNSLQDVRLSKNCEEMFQGQDAIFNLAARVAGVKYNAEHTNEMFLHNMLLQMIPIYAAAKLKIAH